PAHPPAYGGRVPDTLCPPGAACLARRGSAPHHCRGRWPSGLATPLPAGSGWRACPCHVPTCLCAVQAAHRRGGETAATPSPTPGFVRALASACTDRLSPRGAVPYVSILPDGWRGRKPLGLS